MNASPSVRPPRSRGRPRGFDRDKALDIALARFRAEGFDAVSTADLCAAMGISPPSLYAAFTSKADLFEEALDRYETRVGPRFAPMREARDPAGLARAVLTAAAQLYGRGGPCLVLHGARGSRDPVALEATGARRESFQRVLAHRLDALGDLQAGPRADALMVAMAGLSWAALTGTGEAALRRSALAMADGIGALGPET